MVDSPMGVPILLIRADAGGAMGAGHVMRMIALAQAWQDEGGEVHFVCCSCPQALQARLEQEGFGIHLFQDVESGSEDDAVHTLQIATQTHSDWVVLDGYQFSLKFQRTMQEGGSKVMVMDDHGYSDRWCADLILNQNIGSESRIYDNELPAGQCLLGLDYVMLRRDFRQLAKSIDTMTQREPIRQLLVTLGGVDHDNVTGKVLDALEDIDGESIAIRVIIGPGNGHKTLLDAQAERSRHSIELLSNVSDMVACYQWAEGVISAGGSTCYEWGLFGLPGAVVTLADNQELIVRGLVDAGYAIDLGRVSDAQCEEWSCQLGSWLRRKSVTESDPSRSIVDGQGAIRVCRTMSVTTVNPV